MIVSTDPEPAEVLVDGCWYPAEVLTWSGAASGWWANIRWWPRTGAGTLGTFPASEVREPDAHE